VEAVFAFKGRERDAETGLQYYRNRYFDPHVGAWISHDPIGFRAGDFNLSRYVNNDPARFTDPTGFAPISSPNAGSGSSQGGNSPLGSPGITFCQVLSGLWNFGTDSWHVGPWGDLTKDARDFGDKWSKYEDQNAARHAYWQMRLSLEYGTDKAKKLGDAHEWGSNDPIDTQIDLNNNERARRIYESIVNQYSPDWDSLTKDEKLNIIER
jgi:RHS repeat-associated protein